MSSEHTINELQQLQALPLSAKIQRTKRKIREWVQEFGTDGVYVSFSGGKDSTVLLHLVREEFPDIPAVFCDTGLEYPEIRQFVKTFDNVEIVKPKKNFFEVCETYGFPLISKEISEYVYGARIYLTNLEQRKASLNERTNERTNERDSVCVCYGRLSGNQQKRARESRIQTSEDGDYP